MRAKSVRTNQKKASRSSSVPSKVKRQVKSQKPDVKGFPKTAR